MRKTPGQLDREIAAALTALDPYRDDRRNVAAALEHVLENVAGLDSWPDDVCFVEQHEVMSLRKVLSYDDYSSWGEWTFGELRNELTSFRGRAWAEAATSWLTGAKFHENIPAIVIFDSNRYGEAIGDGRGRVSLAVGLGLPRLYVTRIVDCKQTR